MVSWSTVVLSLGYASVVAVVSMVGTLIVTSRARKEDHRKIRAEAYARLIGAALPPDDDDSARDWIENPEVGAAMAQIRLIGSSEAGSGRFQRTGGCR